MSLARFFTGASFGLHVLSSEHEQRSKSPCLASKPHFPPPKSIRILALIASNGLHGNSFLLSTFGFHVTGDGWPKGVQYIEQILLEKAFLYKFEREYYSVVWLWDWRRGTSEG